MDRSWPAAPAPAPAAPAAGASTASAADSDAAVVAAAAKRRAEDRLSKPSATDFDAERARIAMERKDLELRVTSLRRARGLVGELLATLDFALTAEQWNEPGAPDHGDHAGMDMNGMDMGGMAMNGMVDQALDDGGRRK